MTDSLCREQKLADSSIACDFEGSPINLDSGAG